MGGRKGITEVIVKPRESFSSHYAAAGRMNPGGDQDVI